MKTRFFTGKGDGGKSFIGGKKISKTNPLFELLGSLDELDSWLGLTKVEAEKVFSKKRGKIDVARALENFQNSLFIIQAVVSAIVFRTDKREKELSRSKVRELEQIIRQVDRVVPAINKFIIPGGSELPARLDFARTLARRAEREAVKCHLRHKISLEILKFLNRLSSALFALARYSNRALGIQEKHPSYK